MTRTEKGRNGEKKAMNKLRSVGFKKIRLPFASSCDAIVHNARVEIKYALPSANGEWRVNIHRHGILRETEVDAYVFCLDEVPGCKSAPIYLVFEAPLNTPTIAFTFRSMVTRYAKNVDNWDLLRGICQRRSQFLGLESELLSKAS
jgi:hypothetical protein